ncbi:Hypothetical protein HDN1F_26900 [gamma proteobacterium HdN1]|nr:Hypothetical protein HDN1F_26900 [gamma proteobacterium HdN1]
MNVNFFLKRLALAAGLAGSFVLSGCAVTPSVPVTKQDVFSAIYTEKPASILVVPAINHSTAAEASIYYSASIAQPLVEHGYYVLPIPVTNAMLQQAGISDGAQLADVPPQRFEQMFGADAVLFVTINQWDTSYYVVGGNVTVGLTFKMVSARTGNVLWNFRNKVVVDTGGGSNNGLLGAIINTAINTASQDYFPIAQQINYQSIWVLPFGKYHPSNTVDATLNSRHEFNQVAEGGQGR